MSKDVSPGQSLHLANLNADIITAIQIGNASVDDLKEALGSVLEAEFSTLARKLAAGQNTSISKAIGSLHIESGRETQTASSVIDAMSSAASGDRLILFEMEKYFSIVSDFWIETPDFCAFLNHANKKISLPLLAKYLQEWRDKSGYEDPDGRYVFIGAVADFLACNYGYALAAIDLPARRSGNTDFSILAAECALHLGQYSVALDHLEAVLFKNRLGEINLNVDEKVRNALLWSNLGACREGVLESEDAIDAYRHALDILPKDDGKEIVLLARALIQNNLGFSLMTISNENPSDDNLEQAEELFQSALRLREIERDTEPNLCVVLLNLAEVRRKQGDAGDEMDYIDQASGLLSRLDYPHPLHASVLSAEGRAYFDRGEYSSALERYRRSRTKLREVFGTSLTEKHVLASYSIAQTLEAMGDPAAGKAMLTAHAQSLKVFGDNKHPIVRLIEHDMRPIN